MGRGAAAAQSGAEVTLAQDEALPEALASSVAELGGGVAHGRDDAYGGGGEEEAPERGGREAKAADFVGVPDANRAPAAGPRVAVAAKDAACAQCLALRPGIVKAVQNAVANEAADRLAVRTGSQFEAFHNSAPVVVAAVKPGWCVHEPTHRHQVKEKMIFQKMGSPFRITY